MNDPLSKAEAFLGELSAVLDGALRSVVLYGSVARGEAVPGVSDINLLVLVDRIRLAELGRMAAAARKWMAAEGAAPLLLSAQDWARCTDVFAIEAADMTAHRRVLHGDDPVASVRVEGAALRQQTERELRGRMIQLHEHLMLAGDDRQRIGSVLAGALPSFTTYLRATLRLAGQQVPDATEDVIGAAGRLLGADPAAFLDVWRARRAGELPEAVLEESLVTGYYGLVERNVAFVDELVNVPEAMPGRGGDPV